MAEPLHILAVEDSPADFLWIERHMKKQGLTSVCRRVASATDLAAALNHDGWDIALCDFTIPGMDFETTLRAIRGRRGDLPVIVVSGSLGEERAVDLLKQGVWDLVLKDNLSRLVPAIQRAVLDRQERRARRAAERALRQSEERYRRIVETANEGIWSIDEEDRITFANSALCRMLGYPPDEIIGQPTERFLFKEDLSDHHERLIVRRDGVNDQYERRFRRKDGCECWCLVAATAQLDDQGRFCGAFGMLSDISDRKRVEAALRESQARANLILDTAPDAMLVVDAAGRIVRANVRAEQMFGYAEGGLANLVVEALLPERQRDHHRELRQAYLSTPAARPMAATQPLCGLRWDGSEFPAEISLGPVHIGNEQHIIVSVLDITERKRSEAALRAAKLAAENANSVKTSFLANMSHELRTPLNAVIGFAEMIEQRMFGDAEILRYAEYARMIRESGEHLLHLIGDILDMARIETGRYRVHEEEVRWHDVVDEATAMMRDGAAAANVRLVVRVPSDLPPCWCDRHAMKQILLNLISNAVKYGAVGGWVAISVEVAAALGVVLIVRDRGPGIPHERLGEIFEPFNRGRHDTARPGESIGLGLSIVKHLVELHDGTIDVDTGPGRGTAMIVRLPADRVLIEGAAMPPGRPVERPVAAGSGRGAA